jgi:hypothetical protein
MKIKGQLLKPEPYTITGKGTKGMKVSINELSELKTGDKVYQEKLPNGIIILIPEDIYNK